MQNRDKLHARGSDVGSGLLIVAKELSLSQSALQYSSDYHNHRPMLDRYIDAIKELQKVRNVAMWLTENNSLWESIGQFLRSDSSNAQGRGEYLSRRDNQNSHGSMYDHNNSDSDINGEIPYSDESDDYGGNEYRPGIIYVRGAGLDAVNGTYTSAKKFDGVPKFTKTGIWKGVKQEFTLFRCVLSDRTRKWYISIIPDNQKPGTNKDIDFYLCPANGHANEVPHGCQWSTVKDMGKDPAPTVEWNNQNDNIISQEDDNDLLDERVTSNDEYDDMYDDALMEDDNHP